jgi:hypothetical protein
MSTLQTTTQHVCAEVCMASDHEDLGETIGFRVSSKLRQRLQDIADRDECRIGQVARRYLKRALENESDEHQGAAA